MHIDTLYKHRALIALTLSLIFAGTFMYHYFDGLGWLDALYLSIITLTTVGYGDYTPTTDVTKIFTIFYVLIGIGVLVSLASTVAQDLIRRSVDHQIRKRDKKSDDGTDL